MNLQHKVQLKLILSYLESIRFEPVNLDFHFFRLLFLPVFEISTEQLYSLSKLVYKRRRTLNSHTRFIDFIQKEQQVAQQNLFGECAIDTGILNAYDKIYLLQNSFIGNDFLAVINQICSFRIAIDSKEKSQLNLLFQENEKELFLIKMNELVHIENGIFPIETQLKLQLSADAQLQLQQFVWSVSTLQQYLDCPLQFAIGNVWQGPRESSAAARGGTAIHKLMEKFFRTMRDNNSEFPSLDWFLEQFTQLYDFQSEEEENSTLNLLAAYYHKNIDYWPKIVLLESMFNTHFGGVAVKGIIDKIEFNGKYVNIIDYKSGSVVRGLAKLQSPNENLPNGGHYWLQAVFYKLLVASAPKKWEVNEVRFDFLQKDENGNVPSFNIEITPAQEQFVIQLLQQVAQKVQQYDFNTGCGKTDCPYCQMAFVRESYS